MKILIIYDSIFGNTEKIARAVAKSLESQNEVTFIRADAVRVERLVGLDVLIAGSPTRGFRPTSSMSGFLKLIPNGAVKGIKAAAFDTRMALGDMNSAALSVMVRIFGYAAQPIANQLEKKRG